MSFKIEYMDLVRIIKSYGFDDFTAKMIADYLDECINFELDFSKYIWNTALFNVAVIEGDKSDALQWIEDNLCVGAEDCIIYENTNLYGCYIEY